MVTTSTAGTRLSPPTFSHPLSHTVSLCLKVSLWTPPPNPSSKQPWSKLALFRNYILEGGAGGRGSPLVEQINFLFPRLLISSGL